MRDIVGEWLGDEHSLAMAIKEECLDIASSTLAHKNEQYADIISELTDT